MKSSGGGFLVGWRILLTVLACPFFDNYTGCMNMFVLIFFNLEMFNFIVECGYTQVITASPPWVFPPGGWCKFCYSGELVLELLFSKLFLELIVELFLELFYQYLQDYFQNNFQNYFQNYFRTICRTIFRTVFIVQPIIFLKIHCVKITCSVLSIFSCILLMFSSNCRFRW